MTVSLTPLYDRVLVRPLEADERSAGGIVIPDTAKEKPMRGQVLAVGPGKALDNGTTRPMAVAPGQRVIYAQYAGTAVKIDSVEHRLLREDDLLAVES